MSLKETFQTFSFANIRHLYFGGFLSYLGFWLTFLSFIWLVFKLTESSFALGTMSFMLTIPIFILLPFAGVLADRFNKRWILFWCAAGFLISPALLMWATWSHHISQTLLIVSALLYGALYAVLNPAISSFIKELTTENGDVHRVTALLSSNTKIAQLCAAALSGILLSFLNIAAVFLTAFICHLISLFSFARIKNPPVIRESELEHPLRQFYTGMQYTFSFSPFWSILIIASAGSLLVLAWHWQLPIFSGEIIGGGARTLSLLFFVGGIGGILGGAYISTRKTSRGLMHIAAIALFVISLGLIGFSFSSNRLLSSVLVFFIDGAWVMLLATTSATLQLLVDDNKRGRVMSFYAMGVFGLMPFTNFGLASLCNRLGVQWGVCIAAIICGLVALFYWLNMAFYRKKLLPLYQARAMVQSEWPI